MARKTFRNLDKPVSYKVAVNKARDLVGSVTGKELMEKGIVTQQLGKGGENGLWYVDANMVAEHFAESMSKVEIKQAVESAQASGTVTTQEADELILVTQAKYDQLKAAYMQIFGAFSSDRSEIAQVLDVSKDTASKLLKQLRDSGLCDSYDVNDEAQGSHRRGAFKEVVWQCNETYDSISNEEAITLFEKTFGIK